MGDERRSTYLLGGRRVQVRDLIEAGLIGPGTKLRFHRRRMRVTYHAEVTGSGRVRLLPDGQEFPTPSRAAAVAAGMRAVDGWLVWTVVKTGRPLDVLRQELLDRAVATSPTVPGEQALNPRIHERLREARKRAEDRNPEEFSVRELLGLWGAKDRGDQISRIEADLANHGLVTSPSFRKVTLDSTVRLVVPSAGSDEPSAMPAVAEPAVVDEDTDDDPVGLTVGNLQSALGGLCSVAPNATFDEALTKMLLNDFSQLAVLNGPRNLRGAVTWRSIAHARHADPQAGFSAAIEPDTGVVRYDKELIDILPELQRTGYVFVRDQENVVAGIVTTADVVQQYGQMAMPFFQIGEVDRGLRRVISRNLSLDQVAGLCNRQVRSFDGLTMHEYQRIIGDPEIWATLGWPLDRQVFIERLNEIRKIRNDVMHFKPDPPPEGTIDKLRKLIALLRQYGDPS
jgi:hypothetical protein